MGLLLLALIPAVAVLWFYYHHDRRPEPLRLIGMVFGAGFLSCGVVYPVERWAQTYFPNDDYLLLECLLIPGLIEESAKLLVVLLVVAWRPEFDEPVDGLIYGTAAALGFTFGEDWLYYFNHGADLSRVFSTAAHPWFSCMWAAALGIACLKPWRCGVPLVLAGLAGSVLVHGLFDWCILTNSAWLRGLLAPIMVALYLKMDWLLETMQQPDVAGKSGPPEPAATTPMVDCDAPA